MKAIYPGSFDPFTAGHTEIARQAMELFDTLHLVVANNRDKEHHFDGEQRGEIVRKTMAHEFAPESYKIAVHEGLTSDYIKEHGIEVLIRGLRNGDDLRYETELEVFFDEVTEVQTVFLTPDSEHLKTSSTVVRRFLDAGEIEAALRYMPEAIASFPKRGQ